MRLAAIASTLLVAASAVSALPTAVEKRETDIEAVGKGLCYLEAGLGVTSTEDFLDTELGGALSALEKKLGVTALEDATKLTGCKTGKLSDLELIGTGLCYVEKGLGVTATEDQLDSLLGGAISGLEGLLGITALEKKLQLTGC
ncbi:unnamed protein product [Sympodiomycopsis kandeliae]